MEQGESERRYKTGVNWAGHFSDSTCTHSDPGLCVRFREEGDGRERRGGDENRKTFKARAQRHVKLLNDTKL